MEDTRMFAGQVKSLVLIIVLLGLGVIPMSGCPEVVPNNNQVFGEISFHLCPSGSFMMGRTPGEQGSNDNGSEDPIHLVTISDSFWMSTYPITQEQWINVMGNNPSHHQGIFGNTSRRPVEGVTWNDAQVFLSALNAKFPNMGFRLPTEAEWEYACRAGTQTRFYWGEDPDETQADTHAWYAGNSGNQTHDVAGKVANLFGLHDMSGNVLEWVQDTWATDYDNAPTDGSAFEQDPESAMRVMRGGSYISTPAGLRSAVRYAALPDQKGDNIGFRIVKPYSSNK